MSDYVTALTGAGTAVAVGAVVVARSWPAVGERRGPRRVAELLAEAEFVPLDELMRAQDEFAAEFGDAFTPVWRHCGGHDELQVRDAGGWLCPHCHLPTPALTTTRGTQ